MPVLFVLSFIFWPNPLVGAELFRFTVWLLILVGFVALTVYDLRWRLLPNKIVKPVTALALVYMAAMLLEGWGASQILNVIGSVVIASGLFYVLYQVSRGAWIGGGDVKLGLALGLILATPTLSMLMLFLASLLGSIAGLPLLVAGKRKAHIPFGPFLMVATVFCVLFGDQLIDWYIGLLGI